MEPRASALNDKNDSPQRAHQCIDFEGFGKVVEGGLLKVDILFTLMLYRLSNPVCLS